MYAESFDHSSRDRQNASTGSFPPAASQSATTISRWEVIEAYRAMLAREPESEQAIQDHMAAATVADLYQGLIESEEFRERFRATLEPRDSPAIDESTISKSLDLPPIEVQSQIADATQLAAIFARISGAWTRLGQEDPYYSVCADPRMLGTEIGDWGEEFYAGGENDARHMSSFAARSGIDLTGRTCLELGCGVGRVTRWLAPLFRRVQGIDISLEHLAIAQRHLAEAGIENVSLSQITALDDLRQVIGYDAFFSILVLQHNPPPLIAFFLMQVLTNLNPGGVGYFQVPTYSRGYSFRLGEYLHKPIPEEPEMEMHVLPQRDVLKIVHGTGCRVLELREDGTSGRSDAISNTFFVQKGA